MVKNVEDGVTKGAGANYTSFQYYASTGAGVTYTPPAKTFGIAMTSYGRWDNGAMHNFEFYDTAGWVSGDHTVEALGSRFFAQDTAQSMRVINDSGVAIKLIMIGVKWS